MSSQNVTPLLLKHVLLTKTATTDELSEAKSLLLQQHGRAIMQAILSGFAAVAPRSATPNLIELLSTMTIRFPAESKTWMTEILYSVRLNNLIAHAIWTEEVYY